MMPHLLTQLSQMLKTLVIVPRAATRETGAVDTVQERPDASASGRGQPGGADTREGAGAGDRQESTAIHDVRSARRTRRAG